MIERYFTFRWECPKCGDSVVVSEETDTSKWEMCGTCKAIRDSERRCAEIQAQITNDYNPYPTHYAWHLKKPHYRYNWKIGKPELVRF